MKRFIAILLASLMVFCFAACSSEKSGNDLPADGSAETGSSESGSIDTSLKGMYANAETLSKAESCKFNASLTMQIEFDDPMLSEESLNGMEGGAQIRTLLSSYIKSDKLLEIPFTLEGDMSETEGKFTMKLGTGDEAIKCSMIYAEDDVYLNMKELYNGICSFVAPIAGGEDLPVWPYANAYISMTDMMGLMGGFSGSMDDVYGDYGNAFDADVSLTTAQDLNEFADLGGIVLEEDEFDTDDYYDDYYDDEYDDMMGLEGLDYETILSLVEGLMEAIPEAGITQLLDVVESGLKNADVLTVEDGYLMFRVNGDNIGNIPSAFATAMDGKLAAILEDILDGLRNSDNDMISGMIPSKDELDVQEIEDSLIEALTDAAQDMDGVAQDMKDQGIELEVGFKMTSSMMDCRISVAAKMDADDVSGKVKLSASFKVEEGSGVSVDKPQNVLAEDELSNLLSGFSAMMG